MSEMSLKLFLLLFVAPLVLADDLDPAVLQGIFGQADTYNQAVAVTPANGTLIDPDYWDSPEEFTPSPLGYDNFDWVLTKRVAALSNDNFLLSPLGLKLALGILTEAATGPTQAELMNVLGFDTDRNVIRQKFSSILNSLQTQSYQYILDLGSRIYIENSAEPRQRFAAIAEQYYRTELKKVDFKNPPIATKEINDWVSNTTHGKIKNLVSEDDVANVVILILNTLYFKGSWRHQFPPNATKQGNFFLSPNSQKNIQFMRVRDRFYYTESAKFDAKILRMPYLGHKYAMYIVVPNSLTGLPKVLNDINQLRSALFELKEEFVDVIIPKFNFDYTSLLNGVLRELGIRQLFEESASLPGIARGQLLEQRLRVSRVLQRSGIEVNELGSVAYSATEVSLVNKFGEDNESYKEVLANKPFLFYIEDEVTRQLLFTGRVSDPSTSDGAFKLV